MNLFQKCQDLGRKLIYFGTLAIFLVGPFAVVSYVSPPTGWAAAAEAGPSASDVRAAMIRQGIKAGAAFQLGERTYTLHDISVSKSGSENFVVTFSVK